MKRNRYSRRPLPASPSKNASVVTLSLVGAPLEAEDLVRLAQRGRLETRVHGGGPGVVLAAVTHGAGGERDGARQGRGDVRVGRGAGGRGALALAGGFAAAALPYSLALSIHLGQPTLIENHGGILVASRYLPSGNRLMAAAAAFRNEPFT